MSHNYPAGKNPFFSDEDDSVGFGSGRAASGGYRDISDDEFAKPVPTKAQPRATRSARAVIGFI